MASFGLASCRDNTVQLSFRPTVGAVYRYEVTVHSVTDTEIEGAAPEHKDTQVELMAEHTVLSRGQGGVLVRVKVGEPDAQPASFLVRFDRAAQVRSVQPESNSEAGSFGLPEIFPAAAGAPPHRRLAPGARWDIDDRVRLPGSDRPAQVRGRGRLVSLGVRDGHDVARIATDATLPLLTSTSGPEGTLVLDGKQRLLQRATYDLDDGALWEATTVSTGTFAVTVLPPGGGPDKGVPGTSRVRVTSATTRVDG